MNKDEVLDELSVLQERFANGMGWRDGKYEEALDEAIEMISQMSSADVAEVKHGEWQEVKSWECSTHSVTDMKCSVCHHYASLVLPHQTTCTYDFCPFCGADMRERNETK